MVSALKFFLFDVKLVLSSTTKKAQGQRPVLNLQLMCIQSSSFCHQCFLFNVAELLAFWWSRQFFEVVI